MSTAFPVPFSIVRQQFDARQVSDDLLRNALAVCTVQVRGNYCLNSRFLPAVPKPVRRARTLILFLLNARGFVQRRRLLQIFQRPSLPTDNTPQEQRDGIIPRVSPEALLVILQQVARPSVAHGGCWTLKIGDDTGHLLDSSLDHSVFEQYWTQQAELMRYPEVLALYDAE